MALDFDQFANLKGFRQFYGRGFLKHILKHLDGLVSMEF